MVSETTGKTRWSINSSVAPKNEKHSTLAILKSGEQGGQHTMHRKTVSRSPEVEHKLFHVPFGFTEFLICSALVEWVGGWWWW